MQNPMNPRARGRIGIIHYQCQAFAPEGAPGHFRAGERFLRRTCDEWELSRLPQTQDWSDAWFLRGGGSACKQCVARNTTAYNEAQAFIELFRLRSLGRLLPKLNTNKPVRLSDRVVKVLSLDIFYWRRSFDLFRLAAENHFGHVFAHSYL
jgi:hypothetical protein